MNFLFLYFEKVKEIELKKKKMNVQDYAQEEECELIEEIIVDNKLNSDFSSAFSTTGIN